jgi:hypothetical protein
MKKTQTATKIPSVVQLPGGVRLEALPFRVIEHNADGSPRIFELMPPGTQVSGVDGMWALFAHEASIRKPNP